MQNRSYFTFLFSLIAIFSFITFSCSKKPNPIEIAQPEIKTTVHKWFYFSNNEYIQTDRIQNVPYAISKPWTESIRISAASSQMQSEENEYSIPKGFAIVNRAGILVFEDEKINFATDSTLFADKTASNLVFYDEIPVFSVYKNAFFNNAKKNDNDFLNAFLIQFNPNLNVFYPVINVENLKLDSNCEITDFVWDGQFWTCSVKKSDASKTEFLYITFQVKKDLLSLSPVSAEKEIFIQKTDSQSFRSSRQIENFTQAPQRIQELLKSVQKKHKLSVKVYTAGSHSPRYFETTAKVQGEKVLKANCLISDIFSAALFEDGSFYINGALYGKNIFNKGKTCAMKFPKLPEGFIYTDFSISGSHVYAGWEESSFINTGKSGFIQIDLGKIL
mgnify:FL=1